MESCVAYIVFNRPRHTRETFAAVRAHRPDKLFIIADGPRPGHPTDGERCREVREVVSEIDWPCQVFRNVAAQNLGLKNRVSSGLDWVFGQVEHAIILEDDCLPHSDFFLFCNALLERYQEDEKVSVITGDNFQGGQKRGAASYYFSRYNHCWGWATWRRAWRYYQGNIPFWPEWKRSTDWLQLLPASRERRYWEKIFDRVWSGKVNSWAYPWTASIWHKGGLTATPNVNLVTNIGLGPEGTHVLALDDSTGIPSISLGPLSHPDFVVKDCEADTHTFENWYDGANNRLHRRLMLAGRLLAGRMLGRWVAV